jgi:hypothetical protein
MIRGNISTWIDHQGVHAARNHAELTPRRRTRPAGERPNRWEVTSCPPRRALEALKKCLRCQAPTTLLPHGRLSGCANHGVKSVASKESHWSKPRSGSCERCVTSDEMIYTTEGWSPVEQPHRTKQPRPEPGHRDQQRPVTAAQSKMRRRAPQSHAELMTKEQVFGYKPATRLE